MAIVKMRLIRIAADEHHFENIITRLGNPDYFHGELATDVINSGNGGSLVVEDKRYLQARQLLQTVGKVFEIKEDVYDGQEYSYEEIQEIIDKVSQDYKNVSEQVAHYSRLSADDLNALEALRTYNIDVLNNLEFCNIMFGRIPKKSSKRLERSDINSMIYDVVYSSKAYDYLLCVSSGKEIEDTRDLLRELLFEPIEIPTYDGKSIIESYHGKLQSIYGFVKRRGDIIDKYKYIANFNGSYVMTGFVEVKRLEELRQKFVDDPNISFKEFPDFMEEGLTPPTLLRNNWFVKPFEMFVSLYGIPHYLDFDPSPLLAFTYCLLFGIMFGDVGQGFLLFIGGLIFSKFKKGNLISIISRLGIFSMLFGFLYGSFFGLETVMEPLYEMVGLEGAPIAVMDPKTIIPLLVAALSLGGFLIIISICTNVYLNYKRKNTAEFWFSPNGIAGLIFYCGIFAMVILSFIYNVNVLTWQFLVPIIGVPLFCMMFAQPLDNLFHGRPLLQAKQTIKPKDKKAYDWEERFANLKKEDLIALEKLGNYDFKALNSLGYYRRFLVRLPVSSAKKLEMFDIDNMIYDVLNKNNQYYWILCMTGEKDYQSTLDLLRSLYMEPLEIPNFDENLSPQIFLKKLNDLVVSEDGDQGYLSKHSQIAKSWGDYLLENIFELFEVVLSFATNTMSFLRVAGFILSHAGMMLVVVVLRDMSGSLGLVVLALGNIFVIALEGMIVGIQTLRLEYYEMFSRYFISGGKKFTPISADK